MTMQSLTIEVCVDSVESALGAQAGGADRVELCDNLLEGGTTPSAGSIATARKLLTIGVQVIIRPRGGDFCYSDVEYDIMRHDIAVAKQLGADGVVIGILTPDGEIDKARTAALIELARPMNVTFHRAFDMTRDPFRALDDLLDLGVNRILTTGQESTVLEGAELIRELMRQARERVIIMPGGASERTIRRVVAQTGATELHFAAPKMIDSLMVYRNERVFMGGEMRPPEYLRATTDPERVRTLRQLGGH
ncbi:MAG: copper homeostasis protein CutC [Anaerolineae bacterium]|nr:copper homeostasis protein CutC [Anaerolineae bacterium]